MDNPNLTLKKGRVSILIVTLLTMLAILLTHSLAERTEITVFNQSDSTKVVMYGDVTTRDVLMEADITLTENDRLNVELDKTLVNGDRIEISEVKAEDKKVVIAKKPVATMKSAVAVTLPKPPAPPKVDNSLEPLKVTAVADDYEGENATIATNAGRFKYSKKIEVEATAYCGCAICCDRAGANTADGSRPKQYHTIATSKDYKFGTNVYLPYFKGAINSGIFEVEDRGGAIVNDRIDVFFNSHQEALNFGRRTITMYVLE